MAELERNGLLAVLGQGGCGGYWKISPYAFSGRWGVRVRVRVRTRVRIRVRVRVRASFTEYIHAASFQHVVRERELMLYLISFHWIRQCDGACVGRYLISCREKSS